MFSKHIVYENCSTMKRIKNTNNQYDRLPSDKDARSAHHQPAIKAPTLLGRLRYWFSNIRIANT